MRSIIISVFLLLLSHSLFGKEVKGYIKDREGLPISAVIIEQNNTENYTISDINGFFSINLIPQKKVVLRFKYIGYYTKEITIDKEFNDTISDKYFSVNAFIYSYASLIIFIGCFKNLDIVP